MALRLRAWPSLAQRSQVGERKRLALISSQQRSLELTPELKLRWIEMREILEIEEHVPIPPMMYSDPFYRITYLIKEEIRKYKWTAGEKGRKLSWEQARQEWTDAYQQKYEKFLIDTLYFPDADLEKDSSAPRDSST
jgi:hypothetical protein